MDNIWYDDLKGDSPENYLEHIGKNKAESSNHIGSGRYPVGSGENPNQHDDSFTGYVRRLRKLGYNDTEIAKMSGMSSYEFRQKITAERAALAASNTQRAQELRDKGMGWTEIGREMGVPEATVRGWLEPTYKKRASTVLQTSELLKSAVDSGKLIDVGVGVESQLGISRQQLMGAVKSLTDDGYVTHELKVAQIGMPGKYTTILTLCPPETSLKDANARREDISLVNAYGIQDDSGVTKFKDVPPIKSIDSSRILVRYAEDGGTQKDGVIEMRRGIPELDLQNKRYAQVRIAVDGTHYLKGMAMYSDTIDDGYDIVFNTNKHRGKVMMGYDENGKPTDGGVLKPMNLDNLENPFKSATRVVMYDNGDGTQSRSALNIVNEEGDWAEWSKTIASQMLAKQPTPLIRTQLDKSYKEKKDEYDEIMALDNPVIKKKLLEGFADDCDASAVHLKAAAFPRQASHAILPIPELREDQIYAPNYENGETVVLIRYPHAGQFEIPQLTVNNNHKVAKSILADARDAVGINPKVAEKLSGADFDGDTVLVIPNNDGRIKTQPILEDLDGFDPKMYSTEGYSKEKLAKTHLMTEGNKGKEMGKITNLITDMTVQGAPLDEVARAVKQSMVVIDAYKHKLDYKESEKVFEIQELKDKYQPKEDPTKKGGGAHTLFTKAKSAEWVPERDAKRPYTIDPDTGEKVWNYTGTMAKELVPDPDNPGRLKQITTNRPKMIESTQMYETNDAHKLSSGHRNEELYADYANKLKALGNQARKDTLSVGEYVTDPIAKKVYAAEVRTLKEGLELAKQNAPLERQAQLKANATSAAIIRTSEDLDKADKKKIRNRCLSQARDLVGASKKRINITDDEWEAIQAGAVSKTFLDQVVRNSDMDRLKELATPRKTTTLSPNQIALAKSMMSQGKTQAEVAARLGVSASTVSKAVNG